MTDQALELRPELAAFNIRPDRIKTIRLELSDLRRKGILIDLNVSGVGMFSRQADWMELGVSEDDIRRKRFTRGQKYLIPEEWYKELLSIVSQMRQAVDRYTYKDITGFRPYRWLPFTAYEEFRKDWAILLDRFDQCKEKILIGYDVCVDALAAEYTDIAREAWRSLTAPIPGDYRPVVVTMGSVTYANVDDFTDEITRRAVSMMPTRVRIEAELSADYDSAVIYSEYDDEFERSLTDAARSHARQARLEMESEESRVDHQYAMQQLEEQEKQAKINAMMQAEAEHARARLSEMASPFQEVFSALRRQIAEDCIGILESIKKNGYVRGKVAEKGRGLLEFYKLMAAHNDGELRDLLIELKAQIGPDAKDAPDANQRDVGAIEETLRQVIDMSHATAQDLQEAPSRFSFVEI